MQSYLPTPEQLATAEVPCTVAAGTDHHDPGSSRHWLYQASRWLASELRAPLLDAPGATYPGSPTRARSSKFSAHRQLIEVGAPSVIDGASSLTVANAAFESRLRLDADEWSRATPCDEWDVRALVNHVVGANRRHTMLLHGASAVEADATRALDHLGTDPVSSFVSTPADNVAAFGEEGAMAPE